MHTCTHVHTNVHTHSERRRGKKNEEETVVGGKDLITKIVFPILFSHDHELLVDFKRAPGPFSVTPDAAQTHALLNSPLEGFHSLPRGLLSSGPACSLPTLSRAFSQSHLLCGRVLCLPVVHWTRAWLTRLCGPTPTDPHLRAAMLLNYLLLLAMLLCLPTGGLLPILPAPTHVRG